MRNNRKVRIVANEPGSEFEAIDSIACLHVTLYVGLRRMPVTVVDKICVDESLVLADTGIVASKGDVLPTPVITSARRVGVL